MEYDKNDVIGIVDNCGYPLDKQVDDDCILWITIRGEQVKVVIDGQEVKCSGLALFVDIFGSEVLQLACPEFAGFSLDDTSYLNVPLSSITSLEVNQITLGGIPYTKEVCDAFKKATSWEDFYNKVKQ